MNKKTTYPSNFSNSISSITHQNHQPNIQEETSTTQHNSNIAQMLPKRLSESGLYLLFIFIFMTLE